jgi:hypothetical protein
VESKDLFPEINLVLLNYFHASSTVATCFLSVVTSAVVGWMRLSVSLWGVLRGEVSEGKCSPEDSIGWYMDLKIRRCLKSKIIHVPITEAAVSKGKVC